MKLYAQEPDSPAFEAYAASQTNPLITSRIALYEARATFRRKEAEGILTPGTTQTTYHELLQDIAANDVRLIEPEDATRTERGSPDPQRFARSETA